MRSHEVRTGDFEQPPGRSIDKWLQWVAIIGPLLGFILGICTGAVGTAWLYRDHEHRIAKLEAQAEIYNAVVTTLRVKGIIR